MKRRLSGALLSVCAALGLCLGLAACAREQAPATSEPVREELSLPSPVPSEAPEYQAVPVYFDGLLSDRGYLYNGAVFISPEALCAFYGLDLSVEKDGGNIHMTLPGVDLYGSAGQGYMQANGRWLYTPDDYIEVAGRIYLPCDAVSRVLGIAITPAEDLTRLDADLTPLRLIQGGDDYYAMHFSQEELYWLSRIIYAETRDQPMAGLIGVGNVVYNRIASDDFPDTVFDVIFDHKHTVQFDPAADGSVLGDPDERSVIAACLCLEGYNTVGDSLFFVNPDRGDSGWFESALTFVITIGDHDFYI